MLFCLVAPATITFFWLNHQKQQVKHEVKWRIIEGLPKSELVLIQLSKSEAKEQLFWEHSQEFEYQEEMYDVVEYAETSDSLKYWCWRDHEETKLNQELALLVNNLFANHHDNQEKEINLITFYQSLFVEKIFQWQVYALVHYSNRYGNYDVFLQDFFHSIPTPPPKIAI